MIGKIKEVKGAPQLKSVSLHNGVVMGVSMTDEILVLAYIHKEQETVTEDVLDFPGRLHPPGVAVGTTTKRQRKTKNGLGDWGVSKAPMKQEDEAGKIVIRELAVVEAEPDT